MRNQSTKNANNKMVMAIFNAKVQAKAVMEQFRATTHALENRRRSWMITSENVNRLNQIFRGKSTEASSIGMTTGVGIGLAVGFLLMILFSIVFNLTITTPYVLIGLLASAVFGAYLGALYLMRAQTGAKDEYKEAIANGAALLLIPVREPTEEEIRRFLEERGGQEIQTISIRR